MTKLLTIMAFLFASFFACNQSKGFTSMNVDDFEKFIEDGKVQRVDVRTEAEYTDGHIPGSVNIDVKSDSFAQKADSLLDIKRPVAIYCRSGVRSKKAAGILIEKGYKIYELDKGFLSWQEAGKEISK